MSEDEITVRLEGGPHDGREWTIPARGIYDLAFGGMECRYRITDDPTVFRYVEPEQA